MLAQSVMDTGGALQTSLKVTFWGARDQVLVTRSKLSIHPEPSFCATMRAYPPFTFFGPITTLPATFAMFLMLVFNRFAFLSEYRLLDDVLLGFLGQRTRSKPRLAGINQQELAKRGQRA